MNVEKVLEFDKVKEIWADLAITDFAKEKIRETFICFSENELKKLNKEEVIKLLGFPHKELKRPNNYEVWTYSRIKDGGYSGKQPKINIRNLIFYKNKVLKIIREKGNALYINIGTYEK